MQAWTLQQATDGAERRPAAASRPPKGPTPPGTIEAALDAAREVLAMDVAYVADTRHGLLDYRAVRGDGASFLAMPRRPVALEGTYCERLLDGRLPNIVRDTADAPELADLPLTRLTPIGSYIGVPVVLSCGRVYGTFACLSHDARPDLWERDVQWLGVLSRVVAAQLEREIREAQQRQATSAGAQVGAAIAALRRETARRTPHDAWALAPEADAARGERRRFARGA